MNRSPTIWLGMSIVALVTAGVLVSTRLPTVPLKVAGICITLAWVAMSYAQYRLGFHDGWYVGAKDLSDRLSRIIDNAVESEDR